MFQMKRNALYNKDLFPNALKYSKRCNINTYQKFRGKKPLSVHENKTKFASNSPKQCNLCLNFAMEMAAPFEDRGSGNVLFMIYM